MTNPKYPSNVRVAIELRESGVYLATSPDVSGFMAVSQDRRKLEDDLIEKYLVDLYTAAGEPPPSWEKLE